MARLIEWHHHLECILRLFAHKTRQQAAVLLGGPNMFVWPCNLVVALLTFLVITIGQDAPSPSSMENTNCSNVTFLICICIQIAYYLCQKKKRKNRNCSLQFEWNASYDTRDDENYIGRYVCIGCNQAFVKYNDSSVIDDIPENNPSCCNDYTTKIFEERCECLPSRSSGTIPLANVPSPSSIWNSTLNASSPTPVPSPLRRQHHPHHHLQNMS